MKVMFVCWGNICRSPTAEVILRSIVSRQITVLSTGLFPDLGAAADPVSADVARDHGYNLNGHSAQKFTSSSFGDADVIVAMDRKAKQRIELLSAVDPFQLSKVRLFSDFLDSPASPDIPNPWNRPRADYVHVLELIEQGCRALAKRLGSWWGANPSGVSPGELVWDWYRQRAWPASVIRTALVNAYTRSKTPLMDMPAAKWVEMFRYCRAESPDHGLFRTPLETQQLYRGAWPAYAAGMSWSPLLTVADMYATGVPHMLGLVYTASVPASAVLAAPFQHEYVVDPREVKPVLFETAEQTRERMNEPTYIWPK